MTHEDRLTLRGMRFQGRHGVLPEEQVTAQSFEVDVVLLADLARADATDQLTDTADYATLFALVQQIVEGRHFALIEALAGSIARAVLAATDPAVVSGVEVRVRKPQAPLPGQLDTVEVQLTRRR